MKLTRRTLLASGAAAFALPRIAFAQAETIKIGVLHSLSGTMAISETTLKDTMLFLIDEQNKKGRRDVPIHEITTVRDRTVHNSDGFRPRMQ